MKSRLRRLEADYRSVTEAFTNHGAIELVSAEGTPPEKYTFRFKLKALVPFGDESFTVGEEHVAEIFLPADYPFRPPFCRMITPLFHPNISPQKICIGDHWTAGQTLPQLVARIAEMLCFQSYNVKSPLNAQAAAWAEKNADKLPLENKDLTAE